MYNLCVSLKFTFCYFLNKLLLPISYHGQHLFISHRFLKSPLDKLIPHAKIHRQSTKKANDRRKFLPEEREGKKATHRYGLHTNRAGVPPCTVFTSFVFYYVLQHWLKLFSLSDLIHPICLPNAATPLGSLVGERPYVVGWGRLRSGQYS